MAKYAGSHISETNNSYTDSAGWHGVYRGATVFHFLFCGWLATWVVLFVRCVVSTVVVTWYWARDGEREIKLAEMGTWRAFRRVAFCHAGSLALLAFWMPVMIVPRLIVSSYCQLRGYVGEKAPPYSVALAYRSVAVRHEKREKHDRAGERGARRRRQRPLDRPQQQDIHTA